VIISFTEMIILPGKAYLTSLRDVRAMIEATRVVVPPSPAKAVAGRAQRSRSY
jgi:hypothetical protein